VDPVRQVGGRKSLTDLLGEEVGGEVWGRFTVHYTPTHGSWLNQAEIEIGILSRQCLGTRRIPNLKTPRKEVRAWNRRINRARTKINWQFDRKAARRKFGYQTKRSKRSQTVQNVKPGSCYSATLVTTADDDDRVVPSHSFKFTAAMQAAQAYDHPVLIRVETEGSHGYRPTDKKIAENADKWVFAAAAIGMRE
jgi:hypothetical protein